MDENRNMEITINLETWINDFIDELWNRIEDKKLCQEIYNFSKEKSNNIDNNIQHYFLTALRDYREEIIKDMTKRIIGRYAHVKDKDDVLLFLEDKE